MILTLMTLMQLAPAVRGLATTPLDPRIYARYSRLRRSFVAPKFQKKNLVTYTYIPSLTYIRMSYASTYMLHIIGHVFVLAALAIARVTLGEFKPYTGLSL